MAENNKVSGVFEADRNAAGFLRNPKRNYTVHADDAAVTQDIVRRFGLRGGESIVGSIKRASQRNRRSRPALAEIISINELTPADWQDRPAYEDATVVDPQRRLRLETPGGPVSMRVLDLMTPIGFGQRGLIVAPPRTGKTVLLNQIAHGVAENHPEAYMMVLLIDERPEEVTDMRRNVRGEVVASSNDHDVASHVRLARLMIASAKRRVEAGQDVVILLDSLTRVGRAFNAFVRGSGRIMSGGLDIRALAEPKAIFGAARNIENGGSLTIIASALIDTGSRMDEVIFNEFKGTGNMEVMLSRVLANKRLWPAIDLQQSGTRKEELLLTPDELAASHKLRRDIAGRQPDVAMESVLELLSRHTDNTKLAAAAR